MREGEATAEPWGGPENPAWRLPPALPVPTHTQSYAQGFQQVHTRVNLLVGSHTDP